MGGRGGGGRCSVEKPEKRTNIERQSICQNNRILLISLFHNIKLGTVGALSQIHWH